MALDEWLNERITASSKPYYNSLPILPFHCLKYILLFEFLTIYVEFAGIHCSAFALLLDGNLLAHEYIGHAHLSLLHYIIFKFCLSLSYFKSWGDTLVVAKSKLNLKGKLPLLHSLSAKF